MRIGTAVIVSWWLLAAAMAGEAQQTISVGEAAERALAQSKLTTTGSPAFHLRAKITETASSKSEYTAEIEEYWASPEKWRRTIQSPGFSQTLIVNGEKVFEQVTGAYYPWWLRNLVTAMFDPLPMLQTLKQSNTQMAKPNDFERSTSCARFETKVGVAPVQNSVFSVFCFQGSRGLLSSAVTPGFEAQFKDYDGFKDKRVARRIVMNPEPGTTIETRITELRELERPNESLFGIARPTPDVDRLKSVVVSEATLRGLLRDSPEIVWPAVREGKTLGVLSLYVCVDRSGRVREAWPLNADNPSLNDAARRQVKKWQLKPAVVNGAPVQVESVLTLAFSTKMN